MWFFSGILSRISFVESFSDSSLCLHLNNMSNMHAPFYKLILPLLLGIKGVYQRCVSIPGRPYCKPECIYSGWIICTLTCFEEEPLGYIIHYFPNSLLKYATKNDFYHGYWESQMIAYICTTNALSHWSNSPALQA